LPSGPSPKSWRHRLQISIRGLVILVLILGGWLGWMVRRAQVQRNAVAAIVRGGGSVEYEWEWRGFQNDATGLITFAPPKKSGPPWPKWLVGSLGADYFGDVKRVVIGPQEPDLVMARLAQLGRVEELRFARTAAISDTGMRHVRGLTGLQALFMPRRPSTTTGAALENLEGLNRLRSLVFSNDPPLTDADLVHLKGLTALQRLQLPEERGSAITDAGLANLKDLVDMRYLTLQNSQVTSAGLKHLRGMTRLGELWMSGTRVDDLSPIAHLTTMRTLVLTGTPITDAGLAPIARFTALERLSLADTPITDAGLKHLQSLSSLARLDLNKTRITDAGLAHLKGLNKLSYLSFAGTKVTDAGVRELQRVLPNPTIKR
jgi:internalin A